MEIFDCKWAKILFSFTLLIIIYGCGKGPEDARKELALLNIQYSEDSFFKGVKDGDSVAVKLFLASGMNQNIKGENGETPLIASSIKGHKEIVKALIDKGADIESKDNSGFTALFWAVHNRHKDIAKILINKGADVNTSDKFGETPLMNASAQGDAELVRLLLEKGANPDAERDNAADINSVTPLIIANAKQLKEHIGITNGKFNRKLIAKDFAKISGNNEIIQMLQGKKSPANTDTKLSKNIIPSLPDELERKLAGKWEIKSATEDGKAYNVRKHGIEFFDDGTYKGGLNGLSGKWVILKDGRIKLTDMAGNVDLAKLEDTTLLIDFKRGLDIKLIYKK